MSAIAGIYRRDGHAVSKNKIIRMLAHTKTRGPDSESLYINNKIGLGHRLLITNLQSVYESNLLNKKHHDYLITSDANLDNREELLENLNCTKPAVADGMSGRQGKGGTQVVVVENLRIALLEARFQCYL